MARRSLKLSTVALFLAILLVTMLLSRIEEGRKATAAAAEERGVPVLMYHHLLKRAEAGRYADNEIVTFVDAFEKQLDWLSAEGFETVSPAMLRDWLENGTPLPPRPVMITFDDGYLSNFVYAYPLLKAHGYTAVIFSVTGGISEQPASFHANQINMLDRKTMASAGDVFYYASHTDDLHHLTGKRSALVTADSETAAADIKKSLAVIRQFPSGVDYLFSYPYGNYSDRVEALLKEQGIALAFRAYKGKLTRKSDPLALPRYPVSHSVSMDTFKGYFSEYFK